MHVTMILVGPGLILLTVSPLTDAGVYRFGTEKLRVKFEWNKEGSIHDMMAEAEYLANNSCTSREREREVVVVGG
ncbi:hypothetical protein BaRGS_00025881 [Batillaria attramentaria]|uniref:Uncharacterized protein n=1 Tax=Batillaria attramentaria TaxID=370345 RepID=A0ABD0K7D5_9CAEN